MGLRLCQFHPDIAVKLVIRAFISAGEVAKNLNVLMVSVVGMVMLMKTQVMFCLLLEGL